MRMHMHMHMLHAHMLHAHAPCACACTPTSGQRPGEDARRSGQGAWQARAADRRLQAARARLTHLDPQVQGAYAHMHV